MPILAAVGMALSVAPATWFTPALAAHPQCFGLDPTPANTGPGGVIMGTAGADVIAGTDGNDVIHAGAGDDLVCGGSGNDKLIGGSGNDHLSGGDGDDVLEAGDGNDRASGGAGKDRIGGGVGDDFLWGQEGLDKVDGGPGIDTCDAETVALCEAARRRTLVVGETFPVPASNPAVTTGGSNHAYWETMYNGLISLDASGNPIPELATRVPSVANGDITDGGATYTIHLRDDVYWHDDNPAGVRRPFSATDVKFTFEKALLVHHGRTRNMVTALQSWETLTQVASIDVIDPLTVRFRFSEPYAPLLQQLNVTEAPIIPAHLYSGNPSLAQLNANTVGTGPMMFASSSAAEARVVRNPRYFRSPLPYLDEIVMRPLVDDALRQQALLDGQVDYVWDVPNQFVASLSANPDFRTEATQSLGGGPNSVDQFVFNLTKSGDRRGQVGGPDPSGTPDPHPILGGFDPSSSGAKVRKAIAHAINRDAYLDPGRFGIGTVADAPISSELPFHATDVDLPAFDQDAAEALLDSAGWKDEDGPFRVWRGPATPGLTDGQPLAIRMIYGSAVFTSRMTLLDTDLAAVGIDLQVTGPATNASALVFVNRDFDTHIVNYAQGYDPHIGVRRQYHSDQVSTTFATNASGYRNALVDQAFDLAAQTIDFATRFGHYHDVQSQVAQDLPYVWLIETPNVRGYTARCAGFRVYTGLFAEDAVCSQ